MTTRPSTASLAIVALLAASEAAAQVGDPYVVRLFDARFPRTEFSSDPHGYATAGGLAYFVAGGVPTSQGLEVWRSDGTADGTFLLADLCPGPCSTSLVRAEAVGDRLLMFVDLFPNRLQLWASDGTTAGTIPLIEGLAFLPEPIVRTPGGESVLFLASLPGGQGLWSSDGTPAGTRLIQPFAGGLFEPEWAATNDALVFTADDGVSGPELWRTDGTPGGTYLLRDLEPGAAGSHPTRLTRLGDGTVFFLATGAGGHGLYRTDGTPAGTLFVKEPKVSSFAPEPTFLTPVGDRLFFIGDSDGTSVGLWVSDGTPEGTFLVHPLGQAGSSNSVFELAGGAGRVWLIAAQFGTSRLWVSDGTPGGTFPVADGLDLWNIEGHPDFGQLRPVGERVFLAADDGDSGVEPWVSDGTPGGTYRLADTCAGECSGEPQGYWLYGGLVYFHVRDEAGIAEVWASDGTLGGTRRLVSLCQGFCRLEMVPLVEWRGELYFLSDDSSGGLWKTDGTPAGTLQLSQSARAPAVDLGEALIFTGRDAVHGTELWRTDGTVAGTRLVLDIAAGPDAETVMGDAAPFAGLLLQQAPAGQFRRPHLWASDGTPQGTVALAPGSAGQPIAGSVLPVGDHAFLALASEFDTVNLWITDGTPAGTERLTDFDGETGTLPPNPPRLLGALGGRALFFAGLFLWQSDGTVDGTLPFVQLREHFEHPPSNADRIAAQSGVIGGRLVFGARETFLGPARLWRTDGTAAGTRPLGPPEATSPYDFVRVGNRLFFRTGDRRLWTTDGSDGGTRAVAGPFFREPRLLAAAGGRLFFAAADDAGEELWTSDGTPAGTRIVQDIHPGPGRSSEPGELHDAGGGRVYFVADDGVHGRELWISDGTAAGTRLVADLVPGAQGTNPSSLEVVDGRVFFAAHDLLHGRELWVSDGTAAGTRRVTDLVPGPGPSNPHTIVAAGDRLFFHATDGRLGGPALWAVDLRPLPPIVPPAAPANPRAIGGSFDVELTWSDDTVDEALYVLESTTPASPWRVRAFLPPDTERFRTSQPGDVPTTYRLTAENSGGPSPPSDVASFTRVTSHFQCTPDGETLCLLGGRFGVRAAWRDQRSGDTGVGRAAPFPGSGRTGTFSFFDPDNVELIVKALDGTGVNGAYWSFYGALSDVEYWVTVYDTQVRRSRTYYNSPGEICGVGDTAAFPAALGSPALPAPTPARAQDNPRTMHQPGTAGACQPGPQTLCLLDGRLSVEVAWNDHHNGGSGPGRAIAGTDKTGYFWFFSPSNVEVVVKALDGMQVNGHLWVFWGALTNVEYTITVTDTETGLPVEYHNPPGEICGGADTSAF